MATTDLAPLLAQSPLLADLDPGELRKLAEDVQLLPSGAALYEEGDPADAAYVVLSGRLRVTSHAALVGYIGRLQPAGEIGALTGEARTATVRAVRDTTLVRIARERFVELLEQRPQTLLALSRLVIGRLREQTRMRAATEGRGTLAVIPATPDAPVGVLAEALVRRLSGWPQARLIGAAHVDAELGEGAAQTPLDAGEASARLTRYMSDLESRHRFVLYAAGSDRDAWALRCLHSADRVLVLAEAAAPPSAVPVLDELRSGGAPVELVLLRPDGDPSPHTLAWREVTGARAHYFLHPWSEAELASLARQLTASGIGLALGGGGARGFAHIGLVRALEQLAIPVDVVGGASIGAFLAALVACGFDSLEMTEIARETFVRHNYLNDYALPRVSLIRGRKFTARLEDVFGERQIEELRRTYFCVSTSLTTGRTVVHDRGPLYAWVGTSMAIPGVAPPIAYHEQYLVDGGVLDNLPTDVLAQLERGLIVASNVSSAGGIGAPGAGLDGPDPDAVLRREIAGSPRLGEILMRTATLTSAAAMERAAASADVYVRMPTEDIGMFDWKRLSELVERGYEYALEQLTPVRDDLIAPA